jgi:hypothetical protein
MGLKRKPAQIRSIACATGRSRLINRQTEHLRGRYSNIAQFLVEANVGDAFS